MVILNSTVSIEDAAIIGSEISHSVDVDTNGAITDNDLGVTYSINLGYSCSHRSWPKIAGTLSFKVGVRGSRLGTVVFDVIKSAINPAAIASKAFLSAIDDLLLGELSVAAILNIIKTLNSSYSSE